MRENTEMLKTTTPGKFIEVSIYYALGGMSYYTYKQEPRGFWLSVRAVKIEQQEGYTVRSFTMFKGYKHFLKAVKRKSAKAMSEAVAIANAPEGLKEVMINKVLEEEGLSFTQAPATPEAAPQAV